MQRITIDAQPRDLGEKETKNLNQLRNLGWVPAVIYGHGNPESLALDIKAFKKAIHTEAGTHALFNVKFKGKTSLSVIKEVQRDIFSQDPIHVDFQRINVKEKITVDIPVHTVGTPSEVKAGVAILEVITREITLRCLPDDIPPHIDVNVGDLKIHDAIHVSDLKLGDKIEVLTEGDHIIVNVVPPRVEETPEPAAPAEGAEGSEPEVISKGKKDEEEGADAKPAKKEAAKAEK